MFPREIRVYDNMYNGNTYKFTHPAGYGAVRGDQDISLDLFVNPSVMDFTFKSPRPAFAPNTPFQSIGLYTDAFRKTIPNKTRTEKLSKTIGHPMRHMTMRPTTPIRLMHAFITTRASW
jgi:hypothetical protein